MKLSDVTVPVNVTVDVKMNVESREESASKKPQHDESFCRSQSRSSHHHHTQVIRRLDDIADLLAQIFKIDKLLLKAQHQTLEQEMIMTQEVEDLIAATEAQTTVQGGLQTAIEGATGLMTTAVARIDDLLTDLAGDADAVREITARLKAETETMQTSQAALVAANSALASAVQTNTGIGEGQGEGGDGQPQGEPVEPPVEPTSTSTDEPLRSSDNI